MMGKSHSAVQANQVHPFPIAHSPLPLNQRGVLDQNIQISVLGLLWVCYDISAPISQFSGYVCDRRSLLAWSGLKAFGYC